MEKLCLQELIQSFDKIHSDYKILGTWNSVNAPYQGNQDFLGDWDLAVRYNCLFEINERLVYAYESSSRFQTIEKLCLVQVKSAYSPKLAKDLTEKYENSGFERYLAVYNKPKRKEADFETEHFAFFCV
ncbi:MAG: hypothetical protein ACREBJ_10370 [Nitrosotalea sp.]